MTEIALVVAASPDEIASLPREQRGEIITHALIESKQWLAVATKGTDPTPITEFRAWAATVAEMAKQKGLAEEIQKAAREMVRRAERGIGVTTRSGQEAGEIASVTNCDTRARSAYTRTRLGREEVVQAAVPSQSRRLVSPKSFFRGGQEQVDIYAMTDGVSDAEFEAAITDASDEGDLSRANVIRKIKGVKMDGLTAAEKLTRIRKLATTGASSHQIARDLGLTPEYVRDRARHHDIEIVADKVMGRVKRIDSNRIVQETVSALEGLTSGLRLVNLDDLDPTQTENWAASLTDSIRALNRLTKQIKEMTQ